MELTVYCHLLVVRGEAVAVIVTVRAWVEAAAVQF